MAQQTALSVAALPGPTHTFAPKTPAPVPEFDDIVGGNNANTVLLLHCDADDETQVFIDDAVGGTPKLITAVENCEHDTDVKRFGHSSMQLDGGSAYLQIAPSPDFDFGTGDFSIDFWANLSDPLRAYFFAWYLDDDNFFALERVNTAGADVKLSARYRRAGVDLLDTAQTAVGTHVALDDWHHIAVQKWAVVVLGQTVNTFIIFIDGVITWSTNLFAPAGQPDVDLRAWPLYIGASVLAGQPGLRSMEGHIDEFRILRGAVHSAVIGPFTPYGNPYSARFTIAERGQHNVRSRMTASELGQHGVILHPVIGSELGQHDVFASVQASATGQHHVFGAFTASELGQHGIIFHPVVASELGRHRVRATFVSSELGQHTNLTDRFTASDLGQHRVRFAVVASELGQHNKLARYTASELGRHNVEDDTLQQYELFHAVDAEPDLGGTPFATFAWDGDPALDDLPLVTPAITGEGEHFFVLQRRNKLNQRSHNVWSTIIELDEFDAQITHEPSPPEAVTVSPAASASVQVTASYFYGPDGTDQADQWLIYLKVGTDPDPDVDDPTAFVDMVKADGVAKLDHNEPGFNNGDDVRVLVRVRQSDPLRDLQRDSRNTNLESATASTTAPAQVDVEF